MELAAAGLVHRPVETEVLERFLDCSDLHKGFARVYCDQCGHDYLLAYSCKARYFCPSCHQKRMLAYGEWLEDNVLAPVPHRQYVFALPKLIRPFFRHRRRYLGKLCRLVAALLKAGFKVMAPLPEAALRGALRNKVLDFLCSEGVLDTGLAERMLQRRHSGSSVHNRIRSKAADPKGRQRLARYMIRCPFATTATTPTVRGAREGSARMVMTWPSQSALTSRLPTTGAKPTGHD